jgi:hypothetical protein
MVDTANRSLISRAMIAGIPEEFELLLFLIELVKAGLLQIFGHILEVLLHFLVCNCGIKRLFAHHNATGPNRAL